MRRPLKFTPVHFQAFARILPNLSGSRKRQVETRSVGMLAGKEATRQAYSTPRALDIMKTHSGMVEVAKCLETVGTISGSPFIRLEKSLIMYVPKCGIVILGD